MPRCRKGSGVRVMSTWEEGWKGKLGLGRAGEFRLKRHISEMTGVTFEIQKGQKVSVDWVVYH